MKYVSALYDNHDNCIWLKPQTGRRSDGISRFRLLLHDIVATRLELVQHRQLVNCSISPNVQLRRSCLYG